MTSHMAITGTIMIKNTQQTDLINANEYIHNESKKAK